MVALLSPYWSQAVHGKGYRLISNLTWANLLKYLPFLLAPVIHSSWFFILSFGLFMMLSRGTTPAWMEVLNQNLAASSQKKACATASVIDYLGSALLPLPFGLLLDHFPHTWTYLLMGTALLGILSTLFIRKIPNHNQKVPPEKKAFWLHLLGFFRNPIRLPKLPFLTSLLLNFSTICAHMLSKFINKSAQKISTFSGKANFERSLLAPWKNCKELLSKRSDFFGFQVGFFLGGAGLMVIQPILPKYFIDTLHLSYTGMLAAIAACKGVGFILSAPVWVRVFNQSKIFTMCALVTSFAALFPLFLLGAQSVGLCVYLAYLMYGVMQGGSELSWKMSGPIFANGQDSAPYTSVNILMVGLRGLILPYIGSALFFLAGGVTVPLLLGGCFSLSAAFLMAFFAKKYEPAKGLQ